MTTLAVTHPTLLDVTNAWDPQGRIDAIAEIQMQVNAGDRYLTMIEGNEATGHKTTARTGIPTPTWRKINGGAAITKATTGQIRASIGQMEDWSEIDADLAALNGNTAAWKLQMDRAKIQGISNERWRAFFYGDESVNPEQTTGLVSYYNDVNAQNGSNIIVLTGGSAGSDNTSIWLIVFGPEQITGIYPKGSNQGGQAGGIIVEDFGRVRSESPPDGSTGRLVVLSTRYAQKFGVCVPDWRYAVRIRVDAATLTGDLSAGNDLVDGMVQALELIPDLNAGRAVFLCNRRAKSFLRRQIIKKVASSTLSMDTVAGRHVMSMDDIPVERCDAITDTEAT